MPITNKQKALIHVAKAKTGMTDEEYREFLGSFGVGSSTDLTPGKFDEAMREFKKLGFKPLRNAECGMRKKKARAAPASKEKLIGKVEAILCDLGLQWGYADAIARNMFKVDVAAWCTASQLRKLVAALTYHQRRKKSA